jgi:hypothetical protein
LGPPFAEKIAELPASLHSGSEQLFVCWFAFPFILAEAEKHLGQAPTGTEQSVCLLGQLVSLFHQPMAESDVKVQRPLSERFRKGSIVRVEEMVIKLKAHSEDTIRNLILFLTNIK